MRLPALTSKKIVRALKKAGFEELRQAGSHLVLTDAGRTRLVVHGSLAMSSFHSDFLRRCLQLAERSRGKTGINPMVGAVLVREGKIIIVEAKSELIRYIDLKHEQLLYDFRGIFADRTAQQDDKIADHEHRIHEVERKLELAA